MIHFKAISNEISAHLTTNLYDSTRVINDVDYFEATRYLNQISYFVSLQPAEIVDR